MSLHLPAGICEGLDLIAAGLRRNAVAVF